MTDVYPTLEKSRSLFLIYGERRTVKTHMQMTAIVPLYYSLVTDIVNNGVSSAALPGTREKRL